MELSGGGRPILPAPEVDADFVWPLGLAEGGALLAALEAL